jgi:hypothetical protein
LAVAKFLVHVSCQIIFEILGIFKENFSAENTDRYALRTVFSGRFIAWVDVIKVDE